MADELARQRGRLEGQITGLLLELEQLAEAAYQPGREHLALADWAETQAVVKAIKKAAAEALKPWEEAAAYWAHHQRVAANGQLPMDLDPGEDPGEDDGEESPTAILRRMDRDAKAAGLSMEISTSTGHSARYGAERG